MSQGLINIHNIQTSWRIEVTDSGDGVTRSKEINLTPGSFTMCRSLESLVQGLFRNGIASMTVTRIAQATHPVTAAA